ncbi:MAG: PAS domain-containing protein [Lentisphaerae bacterium]|jgi:PAS domain S-box-containing protein|nr:PAS domain-containing protein [Lentisphaerota bacterium]
MPGFFDRLVSRIDKIDPESLQTQMLRLARERGLLETVFQSIQEGVMVLDAEGRLSYGNRAAERLLGFEAEKLRGHAMGRYLRDLDWEHLAEPGGDAAWSHLLSREIEVTYPEHRFLSVYAVPLPDEEGKGQGVLIILRDITRDRAQEASLVEGERLNAIKLLAAGVAHEIGNPLNALNIHLELLAREIVPLPRAQREPLAELVQIARSEVGRLDAIITQFLRALRPARPQLVLADAGALLRETLDLMRTDIENRRIEVAIANAEGLPPIPIDPPQIKQVYFNLIKNALEAMPDGGTMAISFSVGDSYLTLDFLDSGTGIAPGDFNRIFEPYHTTKASGHGLGLMIVQRIVQEHGGQIEVSSKPQAGTRFRILLPLAERRVRKIRAPQEPPGDLRAEPMETP